MSKPGLIKRAYNALTGQPEDPEFSASLLDNEATELADFNSDADRDWEITKN